MALETSLQEGNNKDLKSYYEKNGYAVVRNVIPTHLIDHLLNLYQSDIVSSRHPFFRQNTNRYEPNKVNQFGHVQQSFLDIQDYKDYPDFSLATKEICCGQEIRKALSEVTGFDTFNLMQSMLFDANTETRAHQDWWYLDSVPNGFLMGAWIALEDIDERAGRFFVMPGSQHIDMHSNTPNLPWLEWKAKMYDYFEANPDKVTAPALKKGDILFWNSRTIHGSLKTIDPRFSRKSMTGHYLPAQFKFGNLFTTKEYIQYKTFKGMNYYRNQPDYSPLNQLKYMIKVSAFNHPRAIRALRKIQAAVNVR